MIDLRPNSTIHHTDGGWFSANWHFSFGTYVDPDKPWIRSIAGVFDDDGGGASAWIESIAV